MLRSNRHWCVDSAPGQRDKVKGDISTNSEELGASYVKVSHYNHWPPHPLVEQCSKVSHGGICAAPHRQMHPTLWMTKHKSAILDVFCLLLLTVTFAVYNQ